MPAISISRRLAFLPICLLALLTACGMTGNQTSSTQVPSTLATGDTQPQPTTPAAPPVTPPATTPPTTPPAPPPTPGGPEHFYFGYSGSIYGFALQNDGTLVATPNSPYSLKGDTTLTTGLTLNPAGTLGFASTGQNCYEMSCQGTNSVSVYSVSGSTGELDLLRLDTSAGFLANDAFDDSGRFLYESTPQGLRAFSVDGQGYLSELTGSPFPSIFGTLLKSPSSNRFYIVGWDTNWDWQARYITSFFPNTENGEPVITQGPIVVQSSSLRAETIDSHGQFLFGVGYDSTHVFSIATEIVEVNKSPFPTSCDGRSAVLNSAGTWLYCTSTNGRIGIAKYPFEEASGNIGTEASFVPTTAIFQTLSFDKTGKYLIATSVPTVQVFAIDPVSGQLRPVSNYTLY